MKESKESSTAGSIVTVATIVALVIVCGIVFFKSKGNSSNTGTKEMGWGFPTYGKGFLQPISSEIALSLASSHSTLFFNVIDSSYCDIELISAVERGKLRRRYAFSGDTITISNPVEGKKVQYRMAATTDQRTYMLNFDGDTIFRLIPLDDSINSQLNSSNLLKREEFRYPTLTEQERRFGVENRYVFEDDGRVRTVSHPKRNQISKINILKMF